jgi:hypothetical protein
MSILGHCIHIMEHHLRCVERFLAHAVNPRPVCQRLAEHSFILTFQLTTFRRPFLVLSACAEMAMEHVTEAEVRSAAATVLPVRPLHRAPLFPVQHDDPAPCSCHCPACATPALRSPLPRPALRPCAPSPCPPTCFFLSLQLAPLSTL